MVGFFINTHRRHHRACFKSGILDVCGFKVWSYVSGPCLIQVFWLRCKPLSQWQYNFEVKAVLPQTKILVQGCIQQNRSQVSWFIIYTLFYSFYQSCKLRDKTEADWFTRVDWFVCILGQQNQWQLYCKCCADQGILQTCFHSYDLLHHNSWTCCWNKENLKTKSIEFPKNYY